MSVLVFNISFIFICSPPVKEPQTLSNLTLARKKEKNDYGRIFSESPPLIPLHIGLLAP